MKVLLISGDIEQIVRLYPVLTQSSFDTSVEMYGKDGVVAAHGIQPDAILLDMVLKEGMYEPILDWQSTVKELKASQETRGIPVILLTIIDLLEFAITAKALGAAAVIDGVNTPPELLAEEIRRWCQQGTARPVAI
jgi:CheY-like chemotaxis protein